MAHWLITYFCVMGEMNAKTLEGTDQETRLTSDHTPLRL